jgi:hypothetical protein
MKFQKVPEFVSTKIFAVISHMPLELGNNTTPTRTSCEIYGAITADKRSICISCILLMECFKKLEARLNGVKFEMCKMFEVPSSSAISKTQASKMFVLDGTGKMLHMARNIFPYIK